MTADESQKLLADVESFCAEIRPIEELCYVEHRFNDQLVPFARKHDLLGMIVPRELGGRASDTVTYARALARIGREGTGVRTFFSGHTSIGEYPILAWGSDELKKRYLPAASRGEKILAFGLTEPNAGSNPLEMESEYERDGDHFRVRGAKYLISNGGIANAIVVFAYSKSAPRRISAFVLDTDVDGFAVEDLKAKMGMPTSNTAMFEMDNCKIPVANLLGEEGNGFRIAMDALVSGRLSVAAGCLGVIEDCLEDAIGYAKQRSQHGKEIGKHQLVQDHIAEMEMARIASECLVLRAAAAKDQSIESGSDPKLRARADILAAQAKLFAARAAWDSADRAVQVYGGRGWSVLYRPGRHLLDTRVCRIYEGTDEILKLKIAASVLGKGYESFR